MPQELYNEGRVVGLSAWELFLREALSNGADPSTIPNEQQWLTSMIGMGASMILRIPAITSKGVHDYELPTNSNLAAAGLIIANPFLGECEWDLSNWATKVTSYSRLIENTSSSSPSGSSVPYGAYTEADYSNTVMEFAKLTDGVAFLKNANWIRTQDGQPYKDIDPNFNSSSSVVRIYISETTKYDIAVLLTGFNNKRILQGVSGYAVNDGGYSVGGSTDTDNNNWINGAMLGPEIVPWASKIVFSVPSSAYYLSNKLVRTIPSDTSYSDTKVANKYTFRDVTDGIVKTSSVIDFNSIVITDYYNNHTYSSSPTLSENVSEISLGLNSNCNSIIAWYPGMTAAKIKAASQASDTSNFFPPAVYAAQITSTGIQTLVPLDTAAPGTVKGFENSTEAYNYKVLMPNNYAIYHDTANNTYSFATSSSDITTWSGTAKIDYLTNPVAKVTTGSKYAKFLAMNSYNASTQTYTDYSTSGSSGTTTVGPVNNPSWDTLLSALTGNKKLDILGTALHSVGTELESNSKSIGTTYTVNNVRSTNLTATSKVTVADIDLTQSGNNLVIEGGYSIKSGTQYIEFADGKRLYIAGSAPSGNIPVGSIGLGW